MSIRVRMAPSPTGNLHLGTAYATLWNYLYARRNQGTFILRLEDTDVERSKKEFEQNILDGLTWLGLKWDEGPFRDSERLDTYKQATQKLLSEDKAYLCFCTQEELEKERQEQAKNKQPQVYSGKCRNLSADEVEKFKSQGKSAVVRYKMPDNRGKIEWNDILHGPVAFDASLIGDMVIQRSNGMPLYNFAVVVDDIDMKISHVIRGDDHISNTPKQIVLFEALGAPLPEFAHYPMILNSDRIGKLSKRDNSTSVSDYQKQGYLPEAVVNYLALLGWTMPGDVEIMTLQEMEASFDIKKMRLSGAAFDMKKLDWINGEYIRKLSDEELTKRIEDYLIDHPAIGKVAKLTPLIKDRIKKLSDFIPLTNFLFAPPEYDLAAFRKIKIDESECSMSELLKKISDRMEKLAKPWTAEEFEGSFRRLAQELSQSAGDIFQLIRVAISGQLITPPLFESIEILGEEETLRRVKFVADNYPNFLDSDKDLKIETNNS